MATYKKTDNNTIEITDVSTKDITQVQIDLQQRIDDSNERLIELQTNQDSYTPLIQSVQKLVVDLQSQLNDITKAKVGDDVPVSVPLDAASIDS